METQVKQPKEVVTVELMSKFVELMTEAKVNMFGSELKGKMATLEATVAARLNLLPQVHEIRFVDMPKVEMEGVVHKKFDRVLKKTMKGKNVYLYGPAGSGKNVIAEQVAKALNLTFYSASTLLQKYELLGYGDAQGRYIPTSFYKAFVKGGVFFLDEFDGCSPEVAIALNGALANKYIDFGVDGFVYAHKDFHCIAAGNTTGRGANELYNGRFQLDAATLNRFVTEKIDYDEAIEISLARGDRELVEFIHEVRRICNVKGIQLVCGYRNISDTIDCLECGDSLKEALESALFKGLDEEDKLMIKNSLSDKNSKYWEAI